MTTYVRRQFVARNCQGDVSSLERAVPMPYRLTDVVPRNILKLADGMISSDYIALDAGDSFSIPVPAGYSSANNLAVLIVSNNILKVAVVDPSALGSSTFILKGTTGTTKGDHPGVLSWQGRVTSITITSPTALALTCLVQYFLFAVPDLTLAASWRHGYETLGVIS